jgi:type IX secretion system PorP/SprF family membrane protein
MNMYKTLKDKVMNTRRMILAVAIGILLNTDLLAQQLPIYNHHYFDPMIYNPARVGKVYDGLSAFGIYRKQWTDMPGGPETKIFTIDGTVIKKKVGLGLYIYSDNTDILERVNASLGYSYTVPFDDHMGLTFGLMTGVLNNRINYEKLRAKDPDDPALFENSDLNMGFDASAGVNFYWNRLNAGLAIPQLISKNFIYLDNDNKMKFSPVQHYIFNAQYTFDLKSDIWTLDPHLMLTYVQNAPFKYDIGLMLNWKKMAWLGGTFRSDHAVSITGAIKINKAIMFAYAYDFVYNDMNGYSGSSHEFMLGYLFGAKSGDMEKNVVNQGLKIDQLTKDLDSLEKRVDTLEQTDKEFEKILEELRDQIKNLRIDSERIKEEVKRDDKLPKFAGVVLFKSGSYKIEPQFQKDLDELVNILKNYADLRIDLRGHTDSDGDNYNNDVLSDSRAREVKKYLISKGIQEERIYLNGLGERFPKVPNNNSNNKSLNRRVEIAVIKGIPMK